MRRSIGVLSACVLTGCVFGLRAAPAAGDQTPRSSRAASEGPILLSLNPPLLSAPLEDGTLDDDAPELPKDTQSEGTTASSKPKSTPDAKPDEGKADGAATEKNAPPQTENPPKENAREPAPADKAKTEPADGAKAAPAEAAAAVPPLSQELVSLRDGVRRTLAAYFREPFNTRDNTAANILDVCLAFGCDAEVRRDGSSGPALNGITCLCYNYPVAGRELLRTADGRIVPRVGHGYQDRPGQLLAVLALARVPSEYPIRVGDDVRKVEDLVEYEKLTCREGIDLSFKLIGLARYLSTDDSWKNDMGEAWSISRLVREELADSGDKDAHGGTDRLLALSYVIDCRVKRGEPLDGQFKRAADHVNQFRDYAFDLQNPDGSWHPRFFAYRGQGGTVVDQLYSTGHILRWLVFSLSDDQLQDPRIVRSVALVNRLLADNRSRSRSLPAGSAREIDARMNAVHALMLYDRRVFQPRDESPEGKGGGKDVAGNPAPASR